MDYYLKITIPKFDNGPDTMLIYRSAPRNPQSKKEPMSGLLMSASIPLLAALLPMTG